MKTLFMAMGALETATGLALLGWPSVPVSVLLGATLDTPGASTVGRVAGAGLLALGFACWLAREDGQSHAARGLIAAMLLYNVAAVALLAHVGLVLKLPGAGLWPAFVLHPALTIWCITCLRMRGD